MSVQIVHCSDLHLGKRFNISNYAHEMERRNDLERNFSTIVKYALDNKPDLFLISGDVYDRILPTNPDRVFLVQRIRELKDAGIRVFMIGGNHDVPRVARPTNIAVDIIHCAGLATVFSNPSSMQKKLIDIQGKRVCICGKSYNSTNESGNPLKNIKIPTEGDYNILLLHAAFQGLGVTSSVPFFVNQNPIRAEDLGKGLNYVALGHFHNYYVRRHQDCTICNPGSTEKMTWHEEKDQKGFVWVELKKEETEVKFIPLETRPMESRELALSKNVGDVKEYISSFLETCANSKKILRLFLRGTISKEQNQDFRANELYRFARDILFDFDLKREELEVEGYGRLFLARIENPIQAFKLRLDALIEAAIDEEKKFLNEVKEIGLKYLEENS